MRDVVTAADPEAVAGVVAEAFLERVQAAQLRGEVPQVALAGGTVARLVHRAVAAESGRYEIDWNRVVFWFGDERFVARDSDERNAGQVRSDLLDRVGATRVHEVPATDDDVDDVDAAASLYADLLRGEGSGEFDLVMLGMGPDGHVASLFPGYPQLDEDGIAVAVRESPKPPPERVSLTFAALNRSKAVWFLVTGAEKAEAVQRAWSFEGSVAETPARGISGPSVTWYVDQAAAEI